MPSSQERSLPSITNLPPEITRPIFESAPDFSVVDALARTARSLMSTYVAGLPAISHGVATRIQPEFIFAGRLVDAQEAVYNAPLFPSKNHQKAPSRNERLLSNARCAVAASNSFAAECKIHLFTTARGEENSAFRPSERARFKKSFYQLWTLCTFMSSPYLCRSALYYLNMRNPSELAGLDEMTTWVRGHSENNLGDSGAEFQRWYVGCRRQFGETALLLGTEGQEWT